MATQKDQFQLFKKDPLCYGGTLLNTRKGRAFNRPVTSRDSMHLILKSSKAVGEWSFKNKKNEPKIHYLVGRFANRFGVEIIKFGNAGNHLHFHIKLKKRLLWKKFIRALTGAIAMAITGCSRWKKLKQSAKDRFWDYRPFTRIVVGVKDFFGVNRYVEINEIEGFGHSREEAKFIWAMANSS